MEELIKKYAPSMIENLKNQTEEELIIIKKSDVENLGKKLMKEVYEFLNDEYILSFEKMKKEKDKLEKNLIDFYFNIKKIKYFPYFKKDENEEKIKKFHLRKIEIKIEDESLDIDLIFKVLDNLELEFEIDEDLYCKNKAFLNIYKVFTHSYTYLEY